MFNTTTIPQQYQHAAGDDLKILVVGASIAGISVAQLGVRDGCRDRSTPLGRYGFHDHRGRLIREDAMAASHLLAFLRDWAMRLVSVEMAIKPIQKLVASKPDPDRLAQTALGK